MVIPSAAIICACRYKGRCQAYFETTMSATKASVGRPPSISRGGAGAWTMPTVSSAPVRSQVRQAYFGRRVTITRYCAGILSSRSERSSPMTCKSPPQQGQVLAGGSMTTSSRGRCAGRWPRLTRRCRMRDAGQRRVGLLHTGFTGGDRGLQVLEPEIELVVAQALGLASEVIAAELTQHVEQALVVTGEPGLLATLGEQHRLQLLDVVGQIIDRSCHAEQHVRRARRRQWIIRTLSQPVTRIIALPAAPARGACAPAPNRGPPEARTAALATDASPRPGSPASGT